MSRRYDAMALYCAWFSSHEQDIGARQERRRDVRARFNSPPRRQGARVSADTTDVANDRQQHDERYIDTGDPCEQAPPEQNNGVVEQEHACHHHVGHGPIKDVTADDEQADGFVIHPHVWNIARQPVRNEKHQRRDVYHLRQSQIYEVRWAHPRRRRPSFYICLINHRCAGRDAYGEYWLLRASSSSRARRF